MLDLSASAPLVDERIKPMFEAHSLTSGAVTTTRLIQAPTTTVSNQ